MIKRKHFKFDELFDIFCKNCIHLHYDKKHGREKSYCNFNVVKLDSIDGSCKEFVDSRRGFI